MTYLRSLFLNFLVVFFVNRAIPGVEVSQYQDVPNIGADILFSFIVGFLNSAIFPALFIFNFQPTLLKIAIPAFIISFGSYIFLSIISFGVQVISVGGIIVGGLIVWIVSILTNYFELKHFLKK